MNNDDTRGPAFPHGPIPGMSLRDWFAGMAMQGMMANSEFCEWSPSSIAEYSYDQSDYMLKAREIEREEEWGCPICDDKEEDFRECIMCSRIVCVGCTKWCGAEHDESNGEWFCDECIAKDVEKDNHE